MSMDYSVWASVFFRVFILLMTDRCGSQLPYSLFLSGEGEASGDGFLRIVTLEFVRLIMGTDPLFFGDLID